MEPATYNSRERTEISELIGSGNGRRRCRGGRWQNRRGLSAQLRHVILQRQIVSSVEQ